MNFVSMSMDHLFKRLKIFILVRLYNRPSKQEISDLIGELHPWITDKELVRLGGDKDGGYLVPDDLDDIEACFSPGVGGKTNFEKACADLGMKIYLADASVDASSIPDSRFNFMKKFIGSSNTAKFITLEKWLRKFKCEGERDLLLQMDIEGYEYEVLNSTSISIIKKFRIIVVEFHGLGNLGLPYFFQRTKKSFEKILENHVCVHIHPNNCCGIKRIQGIPIPEVAEFTFLRKDRISIQKKQSNFPHPLDCDCTGAESLVLPENWYK